MHRQGLNPRPPDMKSLDNLQLTISPNWNVYTLDFIVFITKANIFRIKKIDQGKQKLYIY